MHVCLFFLFVDEEYDLGALGPWAPIPIPTDFVMAELFAIGDHLHGPDSSLWFGPIQLCFDFAHRTTHPLNAFK